MFGMRRLEGSSASSGEMLMKRWSRSLLSLSLSRSVSAGSMTVYLPMSPSLAITTVAGPTS